MMSGLGDIRLLRWRNFLSGIVLLFVIAMSYGHILDVTLVTNQPLLDPVNQGDHVISAYIGDGYTSIRDRITFERIEKGKTLNEYTMEYNEEGNIRGFHFSNTAGIKGIGTFRAVAEFEGVTYITSTVVLHRNATIVPQNRTMTAHVGENVNITVTTHLDESNLRWRFNGSSVESGRKNPYLFLPSVTPLEAGVYQCFENNNRGKGEHAYMLLHARSCPAGLWGPSCDQTCTECLNGGKCDEGSGECVCPPGFRGSTCEEALGSNRFGQSGSFSCDPSGNDDGPGCRGKLFCLPDPFGCTCAAGYMGLDCTTACSPGTYGANCLQVCHCNGNNCAPDTGTCICQDGWTGVNCQEAAIPVSSLGNLVTTLSTTPEITPSTTPVTTPATIFTIPPSTPTYEIEIFNYTKVNNGEPTSLLCVARGSPPLPSANISVTNALGGDDGIGFLGTSSSSLSRTSWYQVQVGLDDRARNFRCILHRPDGSSVSSDLAVSVYEPPSFNVFNSLIQDITSHSIALSWSPWNEGRDYGDGPVIGYRMYLSVHGQHSFIPASNDLITDTSFTIHNLTRDTLYDIRVAAVRPGPSGEGTYAPASSHRTLCSAPSEAPVLSIQRREQSSVTLGWALISEESWGCSNLSQIEITVDSTVALSGYPRTLPFDVEVGTGTIQNLQDCTTYRISAAFRNKDELGISSDPKPVSTSLIRPASVQGLQISPFKTQIEVNWELQSNLCSPDYYIIRYGLYQKIACPLAEPTLTLQEVEVIGPTTRHSIVGLDPYSRYNVSVIAVNGAGQSEKTTGYTDTLPGQPSFIANVRVDQERTSATSIGFTWQPLTCRNVNGVFWYYYARIYKDGDRSLRAAGSTYLDKMSYSSVQFDDLEPCTMYELHINAGNRDVRISEGEDIRLSYASGVTGISFSSVSAHAVSDQPGLDVWWRVPSQCTAKVDYYKLSYQLTSRQACPDVVVTDATVYHLNTTSFADLVHKGITSLEYYATYNISIKAVIGGGESLPRFVIGSTSEGAPSPIQSVTYTSTAESLHFIWEEPSCESLHGEFDHYGYSLYNLAKGFHVRSSSTSRQNVEIHGLDSCTEYRFKVRVVASYSRRSEWRQVTALTNISAPGAPDITNLTKHQYGIGSTGLTVTWHPPTSPRCQPTNYEIKYYLRRGDMCEPIQSDPQMKLAGAVNGSTFAYDIKELRANSEYLVFVIGNTTSGYGDSDSMAETTGYSYPTGPPTNIESTALKKRSIVFTWEKPACGHRNGPITSYTVMLSDSKGVEVYINNMSASEATGYEISSLTPYSNYSISIRAWNYELAGEFGPEVWKQTAEAKPAAPEQVTLPSSDQESITVEWVSPDPPEGRIIRYYILYWETDDADATRSNVSIPCLGDQCSDLKYKFSGRIPNLKSDTNYSVQVRAESIRGVGPKSPEPAIVRITSEGIPSDPQEVIITSSTKTSLTITWAKPKYPRGRIISYKLAYKVKGKPYDSTFRPGDDFAMKQLDGDTTRFVLSDLVPATHYEVYVVASTSKGEGESSEHVFEFTAPPPVEDLPKPSPPAIVMSPEGTPTIRFSDELESPYITHMLLAVEERLPVARRRRQQSEYGSYSENPSAYIAASISKDDLPIDFTIGDNNTYGIYHNAPLKDKAIYSIRTGVQSNVGGQKSTLFGDSSEFKTGPTGGGFSVVPVVVGVICALLLVILIVVGFLYYRKRKGKFSRLPSSILRPRRTPPVRGNRNQFNDNMPMRQVPSLSRGGTLANTSSVDGLCDAEVNRDDGAIYANLQPEHNPHTPIPLDKLITYVAQKKASTDAGFKQDYESFPVGQLHPWDVAKKIENKQKNRYINIIAYDHSRVQLSLLDNDPHSDYINASFIDGYNYPRKYIAAQGPNVASVKDFWRMLWQEDCCKIVMLTNLVEGEKKKCEKYWPDKKMIYGKITVTMKNQEVNTHYTVRTFSVQFEDDIREVVQFHYTSWPDMGVPKYTTPLMNFIRTVKQHQTDSYGAIIVHCSAGVGRTGTFITLDTMLDQAEKENVIDVYNFIMGMRQNRVKMVQVAEQYQFIYNALLETFVCGDTSIAQDLYLQRYPSLLTPSPDTGSTLLQEQFERLDMFTIKPREDDLRTAKNQMNMHKNRYRDKIPTDKSRPYLITEVDDGTNYINASFLPGYTNKDMFLGTQTPLPHTVADFWRLVFDYKICTIIMLNGLSSEDQSMAEYWPEASGSEVTHAPFTITLLNEEHYEEISCRTLELRSTTSKSRVQTVYQLQLTTWPMSSEICTSPISIVELHRRAMIWNDSRAKDTPILVHCKDGEGATGTFCALSSVIERLHVEKLVDVFQACKRLRAIRPGAVASLAQYEFIHSVLRLYLDSYDIYENYRT